MSLRSRIRGGQAYLTGKVATAAQFLTLRLSPLGSTHMGCDDSDGPGHAPRYLDVRPILMKCSNCANEMIEGLITCDFGWYTKKQIEGKIVFPSCEKVLDGVKAESYGLGYKFYAAFRCVACELIVVKVKNQ